MRGSQSKSGSASASGHALWSLLLCAPATCFGQSAESDAITLQVGQALRATQRAEQAIIYEFEAAEGETYLLEVDQQGLDLLFTVEEPSGATLSYNSPLLRDEAEYVLLEGAHAGVYRITLQSDELTDATGTHVIRLTDMAGSDDLVLEAWRAMTAGAAANAAVKRSEQLAAVPHYERALDSWRLIGNERMTAHTLYDLAMLEYWAAYDWTKSADLAHGASEIYGDLSEPTLHANALFLEAAATIEIASQLDSVAAQEAFDRAIRDFQTSAAIHERLGNIYDVGQVENNLGLTYFYRGDLSQAAEHWQKAVTTFASSGDWRAGLQSRYNLAVIEQDQGHYDSAIRTYLEILEDLPADRDIRFRTNVLAGLATSYRESGDVDEALSRFTTALDLSRQIEYIEGEAYSLRGIGATYFAFGELDLAKEFLEDALPIAIETNDGRTQAAILTNLGTIAYWNAEYEDALSLHTSALESTHSVPDRAYREVLIAQDLTALGRFDEALMIIASARDIAEMAEDRVTLADALLQLGLASVGAGSPDTAERELKRALSIYENIAVYEGQANSLNGLAIAAKERGNLADALAYSRASLERDAAVRSNIASPELRAFYGSRLRSHYETRIDLLMSGWEHSDGTTHDYIREAFTVSEQARARMTLELVAEAATDAERERDPEISSRRQGLLRDLATMEVQRDRILSTGLPLPQERSALAPVLDKMALIENELNLLETELRSSDPDYAGFVLPNSLTTSEVQNLLDDDTTLVQYSLGTDRSFAWIVTRDSIAAKELAGRDTIERAAREAFDGLKSYQTTAEARRRVSENLDDLANLVVRPIADLLRTKRIAVAADGALQYIPFGVLPMGDSEGGGSILATHDVVTLPSASVLATQRHRLGRSAPTKLLAIFADPVFSANDPRLDGKSLPDAGYGHGLADLMTRSSVGNTLQRLAATAREATSIGELVPESTRLISTGFDANRDSVLSEDLSQYRYLHFATHGLVDSRYPALSALALSQIDRTGHPLNGFLRLNDIYRLKLNADLVVLSACETALGREVKGEGLVGLAQGFLYAGAKTLVMSLWQVPDRATAELMSRFYVHLLQDSQPPSEALRAAQKSIASDRRWSDPYFWGAFIVVGDWR